MNYLNLFNTFLKCAETAREESMQIFEEALADETGDDDLKRIKKANREIAKYQDLLGIDAGVKENQGSIKVYEDSQITERQILDMVAGNNTTYASLSAKKKLAVLYI